MESSINESKQFREMYQVKIKRDQTNPIANELTKQNLINEIKNIITKIDEKSVSIFRLDDQEGLDLAILKALFKCKLSSLSYKNTLKIHIF